MVQILFMSCFTLCVSDLFFKSKAVYLHKQDVFLCWIYRHVMIKEHPHSILKLHMIKKYLTEAKNNDITERRGWRKGVLDALFPKDCKNMSGGGPKCRKHAD